MSLASVDPAGVRFEDLPDEAWPRHEIVDGSLHVTPLAGVSHQYVVGRLTSSLTAAAPTGLSVLPGVNVLRRKATDRLLIPDVAVVETAAMERAGLSLLPEDVFLIVEVISPSSRAVDLHLKRELYAEWGIGSYWVLDPSTRAIHRFGTSDDDASWLRSVDLSDVWMNADHTD